MNRVLFIILVSCSLISCKKEDYPVFYEGTKTIKISEEITIDNGVIFDDAVFNYLTYERFLRHLVESNRFIIVPQKDFDKTNSADKVVLSIRHDVDDNINSAVKFAFREFKYGIRSTYFILHTAPYYGRIKENFFRRNDQIIDYLIAIQNSFCHEIGFHNDLVTFQVIYNLNSREFLKNELEWWRENGLIISGSVAHGSQYCYTYHYLNFYFWEESKQDPDFPCWTSIVKNNKLIAIEKDKMSDYDLTYEGYDLKWDYYFTDSQFINGVRWNMNMVNWDTIKPGKKVVLNLHPQHWD